MKHYGLLGETLTHSYSPQIHAAFGNSQYQLYEKKPSELADFLQSSDFAGLNVTIPYKKSVLPFCASLSPAARAIGSVNTLVRLPDGKLYGDNTDADGFRMLLSENGISPKGKKALIFGSGGAGVTAQYVLEQAGAQAIIISRHGENNYQNLLRHTDAHLLINATPLGMFPKTGETPVDVRQFSHCEAVLDVIYNPARTRLLLEAEQAGIPAYCGLLMLVEQARQSILRWQPEKEMLLSTPEVLSALQRKNLNLILIGMPGAGKTTVGKLLAEQLHRPFTDTDAEIEKRVGMSIPHYFSAYGEAAFREQETAVLREIGAMSGQVIATGGGCVTQEKNFPLLHQNGVICFIRRHLAALPQVGRPLSANADLTQMYRNRLPLYRHFADAEVENTGTPAETAQKIQEVFYEITRYQRPESEPVGNP